MKEPISRRVALKSLGAGVAAGTLLPWLSDAGALAFVSIQQTAATPQPRVLNASQYAALDSLVEAIIPADERSPGLHPDPHWNRADD